MSMTPTERARMREIVGSALGRAVLPAPPPPAERAVSGQTPGAPRAEDVQRFRTEVEALAGVTHVASGPAAIAAIVAGIADGQPTRRVVAWSEEQLGVPGLHAALAAAGLELVPTMVDQSGPAREGQIAALASASIGVTSADAALWLTGSMIIASGPGRPRLASLLTPVHVAIVRISTLVDSLPTLIATRPELVTRGSNFVCITGPSRTADIEHTLSRGVHGPGEVHVVLMD
jgi:L-lactate dehydrogenase complex protein LldG